MSIHRPGVRIVPIHGKTPKIHESVFIAPGCTIIGDVEIGEGSSIWYNCVLRADVFTIRIGERTNVQDGSVLHCDPPRPGDPEGSPLEIGSDVLIGHMAMCHGCVIEDRGFRGAWRHRDEQIGDRQRRHAGSRRDADREQGNTGP
jgi:gamma-carbonic anhydrase